MTSDVEIEVAGLSVSFPLYHGSSRSLKKTVFAAAAGKLATDRNKRVVVQALRDVSFRLQPGDRLGLIGGNGAGKTTLLRTLAGIYEPVMGHVRVAGRVHALLDPSLGMNMDLTGRENIMLRGRYSGLSKAETQRLEQDVIAFAELADFIDLPVRIYSSGMVVRLAFGMATSILPDIVLMDEWLMAGDAAFMDKAKSRIESMVSGAEILVLSSHQLNVIERWCTRVIWLDHGVVRADGPPLEILQQYEPSYQSEAERPALEAEHVVEGEPARLVHQPVIAKEPAGGVAHEHIAVGSGSA